MKRRRPTNFMETNKPNPEEFNNQDGQGPNLDNNNDGTGGRTDRKKPHADADPNVDYYTKFSESTRENQRILAQKAETERLLREKEAEIERLSGTGAGEGQYPGFEELEDDEKNKVGEFTGYVVGKAKEEVYKDPALAFARKNYNESRFNEALNKVVEQYPDLASSKEEFRTKNFNPNNVPDNIEEILGNLAKIHLYDKAKEIGANEERERQGRVDIERTTGGERTPPVTRSLEEWQRLAQSNPVKFAQLKKEYEADLASGRLVQE